MMELQFPAVPQVSHKLSGFAAAAAYPSEQQYLAMQQKQVVAPPTTEATTVLRLRGLPFEAKEADVRAFFGAFTLVHVHLCRRNGKTTGEAYVQFISEEQAQQALVTLDRTCMGRRYIELFTAKEIELKKRRAQESQITGSVLRMRGLPFTATPQDIVNFFEGLKISQGRDSIFMTVNANQKPSGEAFVEFPDEQTRNEALTRDRKMIGHRYIELFTATKEDVDKALSQQRFIMRQGMQFGAEHLALPMISPLNMGAHYVPGHELSAGLDISDFLRGLSLSGSQRPAIAGYANHVDFHGAPISAGPFMSQPLSPQAPKLSARYGPSAGFMGMDVQGWSPEGVGAAQPPACSFPPITSGGLDMNVSKAHDSMYFQQNAFPPVSTQQMMCMQGMPMTPQDMTVHPGSPGLYHPWSASMEAPMFPTFIDPYDNQVGMTTNTNVNISAFPSCEEFYRQQPNTAGSASSTSNSTTAANNMQLPVAHIPDYLCINDPQRATVATPHLTNNTTAFPIHY